ncbi:fungal-specific transcription factor domain-containing protein [Thelonectria olida]|uniref:Fungal-specific transcription factor domain-containing protein n=1 Tax=Thelonectria olida TaxID=1576542 RepID=A0A9P8W1I2_9HYPO|nr:fungal-specific transcription factor domain-containing protein [Thelonectria olida]
MTPSTEAETPSSIATLGRQRSRAACEECRRRKLRCDGLQPKCGVCRASGLTCEVTSRDTRGPKKGHLKALKNRILELEAMLQSGDNDQRPQQQQQNRTRSSDTTLTVPSGDVSATMGASLTQTWVPPTTAFPSEVEIFLSGASIPDLGTFSALDSNIEMYLTDVIKAELRGLICLPRDQLYMDRVHSSIPIIHQRRYLSWSKSSTKTRSRTCLQLSMWTLVTLFSAQFQHMTDQLYQETKKMLETFTGEGNGDTGCDTELVQAWVLTAVCESMRADHRQAWMTAGRVFRLVQAMRLHEIDSPRSQSAISAVDSGGDFIETEEKRRVFWMAYLLDHLFSMRNDWPVTLNEHVICTRLPAPDMEFLSGQRVTGAFLSEAITEPNLHVRSAFNECLILATISGRSLLRGQQSNISKIFGGQASDLPEQRRWLDHILTTRLQVLSECYPSPAEANDPLLLFAHVLGQATVVYYCKGIMETVSSPVEEVGSEPDVLEWQQRASSASTTIIRFAKRLRDLHYSKAREQLSMFREALLNDSTRFIP